MTRLEDLPNVGTKLAAALRVAGIPDAEALTEVGAEEAWRRIHPTFDCLHSLQALAGAVLGLPKSQLDVSARSELLAIWRADKD